MHQSPRAVFVRARNVAFVGWRDAPSHDDILAWHDLGRAMAREERSACVDLVLRGRPRFSDDVRRASEALARDPGIFQLGFAHVLLIPGVAGSAVRAFIGTILLVTRPPAPAKVFGDVAGGMAWLRPRLDARWSEAELAACCGELVHLLSS